MQGVSILVPVYNEEEILRESVNSIRQYLSERSVPFEILITNNGSTDNTAKIGKELEEEFPWLSFFTIEGRSVGRAFSNNVKEAKNEFLICLDADLSLDLRFIDYALDLLKYSEMVVGTKFLGYQQRSFLRSFASQVYIIITQWCFGLKLSDFSMGSKAFRRSSILNALDHIDLWTGYVLELALFVQGNGGRIVQIGVDCEDTRKSRFNIIHEGFYRYAHLYRCWKRLRDTNSWFHSAEEDIKK